MQARDPLIPSYLMLKHMCVSSTGEEEGIERVLCRKVVCAYGDASIAAAVRYAESSLHRDMD